MALESKSKPEDYEMDYDLTTEMIYAKMASVADESTALDPAIHNSGVLMDYCNSAMSAEEQAAIAIAAARLKAKPDAAVPDDQFYPSRLKIRQKGHSAAPNKRLSIHILSQL